MNAKEESMTRFGSLMLCATLTSALLACGGNNASTQDPVELVPLDNDVSGWTVDQAHNKTPGQRAMIGLTYDEVTALIDGGVGDFYFGSYAPKAFLWQNYLNPSLPAFPPENGAVVSLYILQMPSAAQATGLYTDILQFSDHKDTGGAGTPWQDPSAPLVGTGSRIKDTGRQWWINFHQDVYYIEVLLGPSEPAPDYTPSDATKQETSRFAQAVAGKI
jgi:hypothetical protein